MIKEIELQQQLLAAARGEIPADLLITGGRIVNVFSGQIEDTSVAIYQGRIVGFGAYEARSRYDLRGGYLLPGLIEGHIHIESSKLTPPGFAQVVVPHGTTTVIADPHEIANVQGLDGIRYMIDAARGLPLDILYMLPSCVPATDMETAGANLTAEELANLLGDPAVLGIGEVMNFPGAFLGDPSVLAKIALAGGTLPIDGHSPGLTGRNLSAYIAAGPATDHECIRLEEAVEKLACGMRVMIREGSTARNLEALLPLITPTTERRCLFVSDDRRPGDLLKEGHLDYILRRAVSMGLDPITTVRMATLNTAETFGLRDRGGIRPGWRADLTAVADLRVFQVTAVWKGGELVAENGRLTKNLPSTIHTARAEPLCVPRVAADALKVDDRGVEVRVIEVIPNQIITGGSFRRLPAQDGRLLADTSQDIAKLVVVERHTGRGGMGRGFVRGLGLTGGALASTVAHDSHNIIAAGADDVSLATAINRLAEIGGGQVAASGGHILAELPLPVAGLMSNSDAHEVAATEERLIESAHSLGSRLSDPFMTLCFLALPVIPELKLTDKGLVDVTKFALVTLYRE